MGRSTMACGRQERNTDTDSYYLKMEAFIKETSRKTKYKVKANMNGRERNDIKGCGAIMRCMVKGLLSG